VHKLRFFTSGSWLEQDWWLSTAISNWPLFLWTGKGWNVHHTWLAIVLVSSFEDQSSLCSSNVMLLCKTFTEPTHHPRVDGDQNMARTPITDRGWHVRDLVRETIAKVGRQETPS
jgi:hypothetical protein